MSLQQIYNHPSIQPVSSHLLTPASNDRVFGKSISYTQVANTLNNIDMHQIKTMMSEPSVTSLGRAVDGFFSGIIGLGKKLSEVKTPILTFSGAFIRKTVSSVEKVSQKRFSDFSKDGEENTVAVNQRDRHLVSRNNLYYDLCNIYPSTCNTYEDGSSDGFVITLFCHPYQELGTQIWKIDYNETLTQIGSKSQDPEQFAFYSYPNCLIRLGVEDYFNQIYMMHDDCDIIAGSVHQDLGFFTFSENLYAGVSTTSYIFQKQTEMSFSQEIADACYLANLKQASNIHPVPDVRYINPSSAEGNFNVKYFGEYCERKYVLQAFSLELERPNDYPKNTSIFYPEFSKNYLDCSVEQVFQFFQSTQDDVADMCTTLNTYSDTLNNSLNPYGTFLISSQDGFLSTQFNPSFSIKNAIQECYKACVVKYSAEAADQLEEEGAQQEEAEKEQKFRTFFVITSGLLSIGVVSVCAYGVFMKGKKIKDYITNSMRSRNYFDESLEAGEEAML